MDAEENRKNITEIWHRFLVVEYLFTFVDIYVADTVLFYLMYDECDS